jgi:hypothetical protein
MHPVSIRGRSMPRDLRTFRAILGVMGLLCWSLSTGCLRSTMLRPADGPVAQPAPANGAAAPVLAPATPPASTPPAGPAALPSTELQAAPTPLQDQATLAPLTSQPTPAIPPVTAPAGNAPAAKPTPLMDAAIERVAIVTRQQREALDSAASPAESDAHAATVVAPGSPPVLPTAPVQRTPAPILVLDTTESSPSVTATVINPIDSPTQPPISTVATGETERSGAEILPKNNSVAAAESAGPSRETLGARRDDRQPAASIVPAVADPVDPLAVGKLCLCRKIVGFGSYDPLTDARVKAGQQVLLYCEMTGMRYEANDASFVSRLSSKIEIGSVGNGVFQWALELGPKEDVCASRRHDFFVNYKFSVPPGLPPGAYRLRLTQTDLIANRSTAAEIPLVIVP